MNRKIFLTRENNLSCYVHVSSFLFIISILKKNQILKIMYKKENKKFERLENLKYIFNIFLIGKNLKGIE